jgi:hypothetical protein
MSETGREPGRPTQRTNSSRSKTVKPGRLPVTESTSDRAGANSPFGDDITFPLPVHQLTYEHPGRG